MGKERISTGSATPPQRKGAGLQRHPIFGTPTYGLTYIKAT